MARIAELRRGINSHAEAGEQSKTAVTACKRPDLDGAFRSRRQALFDGSVIDLGPDLAEPANHSTHTTKDQSGVRQR